MDTQTEETVTDSLSSQQKNELTEEDVNKTSTGETQSTLTTEADTTSSPGSSQISKDITGENGKTQGESSSPTTNLSDKSDGEFKVPAFSTKFLLPKKLKIKSPFVSDSKTETKKSEVSAKELKTEDESSKKYKPVKSKQKESSTPVPYKEPSWSGVPTEQYNFEVLKNGMIVDNIDLTTKSFHIFGRLPSCDVTMEHPSLSRYHAVIQYCATESEGHKVGWYLYDLDSTHGTWHNKIRVKPGVYERLHVGHVVKLGGSTRLHILQGPDEDQEDESELSISEMKERKEKLKREAEMLKQAGLEEERLREEEAERQKALQGCSWGISEDATDFEAENPFALAEAPQNEDLYIDDPKKALKGYFEREGLDLPEYNLTEMGRGKHQCTVELPIDGPNGEPLVAEATVTGKKKDAVVACALEACRIIDRHGELRKANQESRKKKQKNWEDNDFYDSDEDTFLDRTGTIEKKREMRMKKAGKVKEKAQTFESLNAQLKELDDEVKSLEEQLEKAKADSVSLESDDVDALDAYMTSIKSGAVDTKTRIKIKRQLFELRKEQQKLQKLVNIARPANLPTLNKSDTAVKVAPMFGKIRGLHKSTKPVQKVGPNRPVAFSSGAEVEEEEDEEEDEKGTDQKKLQRNEPKSMEESDSQKKDDEHIPTKGASLTDVQIPEQVENKNIESVEKRTEEKIRSMEKDDKEIENRKDKSDSSDSNEKSKQDSNRSKEPEKKKNKFRGMAPTLPPELLKESRKREASENKKHAGKRLKGPMMLEPYDESDPDMSVWTPPQGQTGDGKTHLNEKFGY